MKKHPSLLGRKVKGYFSKELAEASIALVIIIQTALTGSVIYVKDNYEIGYEYYNSNIKVGIVQEENFLEKTISSYLKELQGEGYDVTSSQLNLELNNKQTIIKKDEKNNNQEIENLILSNLTTYINAYQLTLNNEVYYLKSKEECDIFIEELNQYIKQKDYTIIECIETLDKITSEEILNEKITKVKDQKAINDAAAKKRKTTTVSRHSSGRRYNAPMASYVLLSSPFGWRSSGWHNGVDFAAPQGTEIYSWKDGTITFAGWSGNYGYLIVVDHNDGTISKYAHCCRIAVEEGQSVTANQTIGYVGSTGRSTGPHLHFEIKINEKNVDPLLYL